MWLGRCLRFSPSAIPAKGFNQGNQYNIPDNGGVAIPLWAGLANYYDLFVFGADGNYRDLLGKVTYHGNMGVWLSSIGNQKALKSGGEITRFPDENYAREIMQLFSVGLYELEQDGRLKKDSSGNLIPTYTNDGITELARVFTGFQYSDGNNNDNDTRINGSSRNWGEPMVDQRTTARQQQRLQRRAQPTGQQNGFWSRAAALAGQLRHHG